jgi:hypothetical protein
MGYPLGVGLRIAVALAPIAELSFINELLSTSA